MSFSNVVSVIALFVALSGGAYALSGKNTVKSNDIVNGAVKSKDVADDGLKAKDIKGGAVNASEIGNRAVGAAAIASGSVGADAIAADAVVGAKVEDRSLSEADIALDSLTGFAIAEETLSTEGLPPTASLAAQIRDIGTGGAVVYGAASGRTAASTDMADVQMQGAPSVEIHGIQVSVETAPGPGETRTFRLVRRGSPDSTVLNTAITCTIGEGQRYCADTTFAVSLNSNLFAIEIESVGAGLASSDDAYVGLSVAG